MCVVLLPQCQNWDCSPIPLILGETFQTPQSTVRSSCSGRHGIVCDRVPLAGGGKINVRDTPDVASTTECVQSSMRLLRSSDGGGDDLSTKGSKELGRCIDRRCLSMADNPFISQMVSHLNAHHWEGLLKHKCWAQGPRLLIQ